MGRSSLRARTLPRLRLGSFGSSDGIKDHVIRYLPRDYDIFRRMNPGDQYPQAYEHALHLFREKLERAAKTGRKMRAGSLEYERLKKETVPPYDAGKFPNKWRKMERDLPARTLMAHLGKDGYSQNFFERNRDELHAAIDACCDYVEGKLAAAETVTAEATDERKAA